MWLRLRQIALVAHEIGPVTDELCAIFGIEVAHIDPGVKIFGLENRVIPIGNQFLEIVSPTEENTAAGRYLDRRGGDGGYMVITQCDDHAARRKHVLELGVRIAFQIDQPAFQGIQLHPRDTGGSFFEIDWQGEGDAPDGPWMPAGPDWQRARRTDVVVGIAAAELQSPDPERLAGRWSEIAEIPLSRDADGQPELRLENARLRFGRASDGRGEGLGGVDLIASDRDRALRTARERGHAADGDHLLLCGTRFRLVG